MNKTIEAGCLAIITGGNPGDLQEHMGMVVTVTAFSYGAWLFECEGYRGLLGNGKGVRYHEHLLRIDDYTEETETQEEEMTV